MAAPPEGSLDKLAAGVERTGASFARLGGAGAAAVGAVTVAVAAVGGALTAAGVPAATVASIVSAPVLLGALLVTVAGTLTVARLAGAVQAIRAGVRLANYHAAGKLVSRSTGRPLSNRKAAFAVTLTMVSGEAQAAAVLWKTGQLVLSAVMGTAGPSDTLGDAMAPEAVNRLIEELADLTILP